MRRYRAGFTLIELLVVIAIIGILSTLVITRLTGGRIKARNATARADINELAKSVEVFISDDSNSSPLPIQASYASGANCSAGDNLVTTTDDHFKSVFSGTQQTVKGRALPLSAVPYLAYANSVGRSQGVSYTYRYCTAGSTIASGNHDRQAPTKNYTLWTTLDTGDGSTDVAFWVANGTSASSSLSSAVPTP